MTSIRRYLVTLLIALITLTSFLAALQSYKQSSRQAEQLFDDDLKVLAASLLAPYQPAAQQNTIGNAPAPIQTNAVQLWHQGELLFHSQQAPHQPISAVDGFAEQNFAGRRWQTFRASTADGYMVIVAQPLADRLALSDQVVLASIYPVVLSLPLQALLIWLLVSKGLRPLLEFARQLQQKKAGALSPVLLTQTPEELKDVLSTTNQLLARLDEAFNREQRFAADVAHELRTPLAVLQVNLHNAEQYWQQQQLADPDQLMPALRDGVARMSGLIEQILLLNRTDPAQFHSRLQPLDLAALSREVIAELYPKIAQRQQQIVMDSEDDLTDELCREATETTVQAPLLVAADRFAMHLLLVNLLGNASKYTPAGGELALTLKRQGAQLCWQLDDSGPGIAETEFERVFERFYRVGGDRHATQAHAEQAGAPVGSGLGLAIARDIALLHQGELTLARSPLGGLRVTLLLPALTGRALT